MTDNRLEAEEFALAIGLFDQVVTDDEEDFLLGVTCNPDAPEECESCQ